MGRNVTPRQAHSAVRTNTDTGFNAPQRSTMQTDERGVFLLRVWLTPRREVFANLTKFRKTDSCYRTKKKGRIQILTKISEFHLKYEEKWRKRQKWKPQNLTFKNTSKITELCTLTNIRTISGCFIYLANVCDYTSRIHNTTVWNTACISNPSVILFNVNYVSLKLPDLSNCLYAHWWAHKTRDRIHVELLWCWH